MCRKGVFPFLLLLLLLAACGESHEEMLRQLEELERMNRADSVMHNDSLAEALTRYFDRHGSANERMRAHYILGRTYADMGEAPAALNAYLDAADCADTTATDCDYHTLSRVYGQMADVFYWQNLMEDYIKACDKSVNSAWKDKDTLQALNGKAHKLLAYNRLKQYNNVIVNFDVVFNELQQKYGISTAAKYAILPVNALIQTGDYEKAGKYLDIVEHESGYFDSAGNVEIGREGIYYYMGRYYFAVHQYDSAESCFRKELITGLDVDNQQMASHGLSLVYSQTHRLDSAIKYALYNNAMLDSVIARQSTADVERMAALHNYTRHQEIANQEHIRADYEKGKNERLSIIILLIIASVCIAWFFLAKKRHQAAEQYRRNVRELAHVTQNLQDLKGQKELFEKLANEEMMQKSEELFIVQQKNDTLAKQIEDANGILAQLRKELMARHEEAILSNQEIDARLEKIPAYQRLQKKASGHEALTRSDWKSVESLVEKELPGFYNLISSRQSSLRLEGRRLCYLLRLHVGLKEAGVLMGVSQPQISKISRSILLRVFQEEGSGKELTKRLQDIF